ncbi:MAG: hypothetical protein LBP85_06985 [Prevotellaceae bacterium]|jgi:hypothetical protein|nr:hypothetical protein [Prevotellaceae bacterium]
MEDIKKWIESETPDYLAGVALFSKYNKNRAIAQWLGRVGEKRGMSKLRYEFTKLVKTKSIHKPELKINKVKSQTSTKNNKQAELKPERIIIDVEGRIKREDLPEQIQKLYDENVEKYKIMRGAHADMKAEKNKNQRKKLRMQIAEQDDIISKNWEIIDEWVLTQSLPPDSENDDDNTAGDGSGRLTPQQVNTFRTYISRTVAEPDKIDDSKRSKTQERITALLNDGQSFDEETTEKLKSLGFNTESNIPAQNRCVDNT